MPSTETSARISLRGDVIRHESANGIWELPIEHVQVIGEATTDHGPFLDDYWICFASGPEKWYEASFYAVGRDEFLRALSDRLGTPIELDLVGSTNYSSRVVWPGPLADKPMFVYTEEWPNNWLLRVLVKLIGGTFGNVQTFSPEVERYLQETARTEKK